VHGIDSAPASRERERLVGLYLRSLTLPACQVAAAPGSSSLILFQHGQERLLRHFHLPDLLHAFLALGLLGPELAFPRDVTAIALGGHVLAHGGDILTRDHPR